MEDTLDRGGSTRASPPLSKTLVHIMIITSKYIQNTLFFYCKCLNYDWMVANKYALGWHECDFLSIAKSNYWTEYEIKISRADFRNDFKNKPAKHLILESAANNKSKTKPPNRFYFVCPEGLLKEDEIPSYAGLMYVTEGSKKNGHIRVIKDAPLLHREKINDDFKVNIAKKYMYDYWGRFYGDPKARFDICDCFDDYQI